MGRGQELLDAARNGDKRTVEKILGQITKRSGPFTSLRRGAGVNVQDDNGYTPLHHACLNGHKEIVRLLLSVDASPRIADKRGATPLHLAAWKGESNIVSMLLAHKNPPVDVDQLTADHETALLSAAHFGYTDVVAQLIAKGADVTIRNIRDESALDLAAQYGRLETVQHLLRVMPQLVEPYKAPRCRGKTFPSTPLHRASKNGRKEVVHVLLAAGIDPNIRTYNGGTPLHEAACFGKASVVRILLANGANLNEVDRHGMTVHDLLADYSEEATRKVRRVIRDYENCTRITYESEEELPPFPVVVDNSPTSYPLPNIVCDRKTDDAVDSLSPQNDASITNKILGNVENYDSVSNADNIRQYKTLSPLLKKDIIEVSKQFRERSNTYTINHDSVDGNKMPDDIYVNQTEIGHFGNKNFESGIDEEFELYQNLEPPRKISDDTSPTFSKKKPKPPPKPRKHKKCKAQGSVLGNHSSKEKHNKSNKGSSNISKQICMFESKDDKSVIKASAPVSTDTENVYMNTLNLPDDEKAKKRCPDTEDLYMPMDKCASITSYVQMDNNKYDRKKVISDTQLEYRIYGDTSNAKAKQTEKNKYTCMDRRKQFEMSRRTNPDISKLCASLHTKGDNVCMYERLDYLYVYDLNPDALRMNAHPFIRRKEKATSIPCLCPGHDGISPKINPKKDKTKDVDASQLVYYSCEDIYVHFDNNKVYSSLSDLSQIENRNIRESVVSNIDASGNALAGKNVVFKPFADETPKTDKEKTKTAFSKKMSVIKKKFDQMKVLFTDWE